MNRLIKRGESVNRLGSRRLGGYLVTFEPSMDSHTGSALFSPHTDFGRERKTITLYHHGLDPAIKRRPIGEAVLDVNDAGVWVEAQLQKRDEYEEMLLELAERGELEWSSAADRRHVRTRSIGHGHNRVERWPLGLEASATPAGQLPRGLVDDRRIERPTKSLIPSGRPRAHGAGGLDSFDARREVRRALHTLKRIL
jgi:hypothetical protein